MRSSALALVALLAGCVGLSRGGDPPAAGPTADAHPVARPGKSVGLADGRAYALALVNRDRAAAGLSPVTLDRIASEAAERHVKDLVAHGVTSHWGTDGSVPELRYTEAGGEDLSAENVACFGDAKSRPVDADGPFDPAAIERFEAAFMAEVAPNDGHRKNILGPRHTRVGIGLATSPGTDVVCLVQEFVDDYGEYAPLPKTAKQGQTIHIEGTVFAPATFGGVGLSRIPLPEPRSPADLLKTGGYRMPEPYVAYFAKGFKTPKPVDVQGNHFSIDVPLANGSGVYEVGVFAKFPESGNELSPISLRTITVR